MGLMSKRDYNNYFQFFQTLKRMVQPPDLVIYLQGVGADAGGADPEAGTGVRGEYPAGLFEAPHDYYNKWIDGYKEGPLLIVDIDKNKFPENEEHLGEIITRIDSQLYGLF